MTSYADTAALMKQQRIPPIVGWEEAAKMLEQWLVIVTVLLGPQERHPTVFELATLLEAADEVNSRLRAQEAVQQYMPAALVQLIQTGFDNIFRQVFTSHLPVRWPHFNPLIRTLTTGHFHLDTITMPEGFRHNLPTAVTPHLTTYPPHKTSAAQRGGEPYTATSQVGVHNPAPLPHLQVGPGFRLRQSMEQAANATGASVPQTDDGRPFCLSYHLKGVSKSNGGVCHAHRTLSPHNQGVLSAWKSRFCDAPPPIH